MNNTNPFPGMNPFLERRWPEVHLKLIALVAEELGTELPTTYEAVVESRVSVVGGESGAYRPDISVVEDSWKQGLPPVWQPDNETRLVVAEPIIVDVAAPPQRWIEIRHDDGRLVTVIEIISPTNRGGGREDYQAKRSDFLSAGINVVEIDLLREGRRIVDLDEKLYAARFGTGEHFTMCITRAPRRGRREIYAALLREPLPIIRIPLRFPDPDVPLNLQALLSRVYASGRYWKLDFRAPLDPPLNAEDQAWVNERLVAAGLL